VEEDFDRFVNLPSEVGNYLSKLKNEFAYTVNPLTDECAKSVHNAFKSNNDTVASKSDEPLSNLDQINLVITPTSSQPSNSGPSIKVIGKIDVSKFEKPKKEIRKNKENLYIIDTNVFVDCPEIISKIHKDYPVILSAKVVDELDSLKIKLDTEGKINVQKALKSINRNIDKRGLRMEIADLSLLPIDFNKRSPDNRILTVALKFKSENPILLTSDNGLQIKAKGLKITTITLKEFLNQLKRR